MDIKIIALLLCSLSAAGADKDWIERSNQNAQLLLKIQAKYAPEGAAQFGIEGLDEEIIDLGPNLEKRVREDVEKAVTELEKRKSKEDNPFARQDLDIMIAAARQNLEGQELTQKHEYTWFQMSAMIFGGVRGLLDDQVAEERRPAALVRLKKYAGLNGGESLVSQARARMTESRARRGLAWPVKAELERYLQNSPRYLAGVKQLFAKYGIEGYEEAHGVLEKQIGEFDDFLREEYLPKARTDYRLPDELYRFSLKSMGIEMAPEELISRAQVAFMEIIFEMNALAPMVAREMGIEATDYRQVIKAMKKKQIEGEAILPHYKQRIKQLEELIHQHELVSLPEREMRIRLASEAESAGVPAPNMRPPRLIGNTGEMGEFVLPLKIPAPEGQEDMTMDDFTFEAASWTLTAHEGRPGHEMQFAAMVESGVSIARSLYAFNSANVEGWALYAEAISKPHLPLDGQLIALQHRLLRAARAFLDPQLQMGKISPEEAKRLLLDKVVLSEAMANQEVDRYTFRSPGQAPSYFYGYTSHMALRTEVELILGDQLDLSDYHDFVLAQGLLPPHLLRDAVLERYVPAVLKQKGRQPSP